MILSTFNIQHSVNNSNHHFRFIFSSLSQHFFVRITFKNQNICCQRTSKTISLKYNSICFFKNIETKHFSLIFLLHFSFSSWKSHFTLEKSSIQFLFKQPFHSKPEILFCTLPLFALCTKIKTRDWSTAPGQTTVCHSHPAKLCTALSVSLYVSFCRYKIPCLFSFSKPANFGQASLQNHL